MCNIFYKVHFSQAMIPCVTVFTSYDSFSQAMTILTVVFITSLYRVHDEEEFRNRGDRVQIMLLESVSLSCVLRTVFLDHSSWHQSSWSSRISICLCLPVPSSAIIIVSFVIVGGRMHRTARMHTMVSRVRHMGFLSKYRSTDL